MIFWFLVTMRISGRTACGAGDSSEFVTREGRTISVLRPEPSPPVKDVMYVDVSMSYSSDYQANWYNSLCD